MLRTVGAHLVTPPCDDEDEGALLLEAFVAARRDPEVRQLILSILDGRSSQLAELVEAGKAAGTIDADLDNESLVVASATPSASASSSTTPSRFRCPAPAPWEQLIARLVAALAPSTDVPPKGD